jgi:hypothetical protein
MEFFDQLGTAIERRWRGVNYLEEEFPAIAAEELLAADATGKLDSWEIIKNLHAAASLLEQQTETFSDLAITFYRGSRFAIEVYFWMDSTTSIHQHSFSGAFQVLAGSSIHNLYQFDLKQRINAHFAVGHVLLKNVQALRKGDIRKISPGKEFIHSLFHLESPSITITVRTFQDPNTLPQYSYFKPHFAVNELFKDPLTTKKLQSVLMLLRTRSALAYDHIAALLSESDFYTTFLIVNTAYDRLVQHTQKRFRSDNANDPPDSFPQEKARFGDLLSRAQSRHGSLSNFLLPVLFESQKTKALVHLRTRLVRPEDRFFLALLLNVETRAQMVGLIKEHWPNRDPVECICDWVQELSTQTGRDGGANVLGIQGFEPAHLAVLRHVLRDQTSEGGQGTQQNNSLPDIPAVEYQRIFDSLQKSIVIKSILSQPTTANSTS